MTDVAVGVGHPSLGRGFLGVAPNTAATATVAATSMVRGRESITPMSGICSNATEMAKANTGT